MPIYEFECEKCKSEREEIRKFSDDLPICSCGNKMKKKISMSSFHLKGSGWYTTDYKNKPVEKPKTTEEKSYKKVDNPK